MTLMVDAQRVRKNFGSHKVLKGIELAVAPGDVTCLIGPSGSGKSTFLRCINHLEKIDGWRLLVDGDHVGYRQEGEKLYELTEREVARKRAGIGMVTQDTSLLHRSIRDNIAIGRTEADDAAIMEALRRAQADGFVAGLVDQRGRKGLDALVGEIASEARAGDHILVMSNGGFGGIHGKLLAALGR